MKSTYTFLFIFIVCVVNAQNFMVPGDASLETKCIKNEKYQMKWYILQDTAKHEVARINTQIKPSNGELIIISNVEVNNAKTKWIDSTIALLPSLLPVRHYSDNLERSVQLKFGAGITGLYNDKLKKNKVTVSADVQLGQYFDSNLLPYLIRLLPLKNGYTQNIITYDYSPAKNGLITAQVTNVKTGSYRNFDGLNVVWIVTVMETVKGQTTEVKYYIDKTNRKIYKQEIFDGVLRTLIERVE